MGYVYNIDYIIDYDYVDKNNKLTHKGFLKYLCGAATSHADETPYGFKASETTHLAWLVLGWKIEIYRRPKCNEKIHIETWSTGAERVCSYRDFKMYDKKNNLIAIASSKWTLYNLEKASLVRITPEIMETFHSDDTTHVFTEKVSKINVPELECLGTYEYNIMRRDIDTNNHVNNGNYFDIANEVLPEEIYNIDFKNIDVMYKNQALYGDKTISFYYSTGSEHYVVIKSEDLSKTHCIIKLS